MNPIEQTLIGGVAGGTSILLPALGELIGERAGIINLGTEGAMLAGALASYAMTQTSGNIWLGIAAGIAGGALVGLAHAWLTVRRGGDQIASGLLLWFLALGVTSVYGTSYVGTVITPLSNIAIPGLNKIPWAGPILFDQDILVYASYFLVGIIWFVFYRTRVGLTLRATGERPEVVAATGGKPQRVQIIALTIGAGLGGLGGAQLSIGYVGNWFNDMTSGYGFVAVAVVLFAAWRPVRVLAGAYLFGIVLAAASVLQAHGVSINQYLLDAMPYLATLLVLALFARRGRSDTPEALTRSLSRSGT
jgi:simple sugar transport system permease protein